MFSPQTDFCQQKFDISIYSAQRTSIHMKKVKLDTDPDPL